MGLLLFIHIITGSFTYYRRDVQVAAIIAQYNNLLIKTVITYIDPVIEEYKLAMGLEFRTREQVRKRVEERIKRESEEIVRARLVLMDKIETEVRERFEKKNGV